MSDTAFDWKGCDRGRRRTRFLLSNLVLAARLHALLATPNAFGDQPPASASSAQVPPDSSPATCPTTGELMRQVIDDLVAKDQQLQNRCKETLAG
jgi:hypothetical protein